MFACVFFVNIYTTLRQNQNHTVKLIDSALTQANEKSG
jgi:hypothetical protein